MLTMLTSLCAPGFQSALNQSMRFLERTASDLPVSDPLQPQMMMMRLKSIRLQSVSAPQNKVTSVIEAVEAAQFLISQNATHLVNQVPSGHLLAACSCSSGEGLVMEFGLFPPQETGKFTATIVGYFHQYIQWVKTSVSCSLGSYDVFILVQNKVVYWQKNLHVMQELRSKYRQGKYNNYNLYKFEEFALWHVGLCCN